MTRKFLLGFALVVLAVLFAAPIGWSGVEQFSISRFAFALTLAAPLFGMAMLPADQAAAAIQRSGGDINAVMGGWKDRGPWSYYDNAIFAGGTALPNPISLFSIPLNQPDPNNSNALKTKLNTNGLAANAMPSNRCLVLESIGIYFADTMLKSDIDAFINAYYMEFKIEEKIYYEGPLWQYPSGLGLFGATDRTGESSWQFGLASPYAAKRYGKYSKYIAPLQPFTWQLILGQSATVTPLQTFLLYGVLDGLTDRSVQ